jgi:hypothetical protein
MCVRCRERGARQRQGNQKARVPSAICAFAYPSCLPSSLLLLRAVPPPAAAAPAAAAAAAAAAARLVVITPVPIPTLVSRPPGRGLFGPFAHFIYTPNAPLPVRSDLSLHRPTEPKLPFLPSPFFNLTTNASSRSSREDSAFARFCVCLSCTTPPQISSVLFSCCRCLCPAQFRFNLTLDIYNNKNKNNNNNSNSIQMNQPIIQSHFLSPSPCQNPPPKTRLIFPMFPFSPLNLTHR